MPHLKLATVKESDDFLKDHYANVQMVDEDGVDISEKPMPHDPTDQSDE